MKLMEYIELDNSIDKYYEMYSKIIISNIAEREEQRKKQRRKKTKSINKNYC